MARIIYALSGQGRGHSSRVIAISDELRSRGHDVYFCCGGTARDILEARSEKVIPVPPLKQVVEGNELKVMRTLLRNARRIFRMNAIVDELAESFRSVNPDLVITDFEAFSPRAARKLNIPVMSFNHQEVVTRTKYKIPTDCRIQAISTSLAINLVAPRNAVHTLMTSFYFPDVINPETTTLVGPIIRPEVMNLAPTDGDHILVYFNQPRDSEGVLDEFEKTGHQYIVYNFPSQTSSNSYNNIVLKQPSIDGFLRDLASCRAVICTAGFTLISESIYLGKPILVVPNRGIFEQTLNAYFLKESGFGDAVLKGSLTSNHIADFLAKFGRSEEIYPQLDCGNSEAIQCIEQVLKDYCSSPNTVGTRSLEQANA